MLSIVVFTHTQNVLQQNDRGETHFFALRAAYAPCVGGASGRYL